MNISYIDIKLKLELQNLFTFQLENTKIYVLLLLQ